MEVLQQQQLSFVDLKNFQVVKRKFAILDILPIQITLFTLLCNINIVTNLFITDFSI